MLHLSRTERSLLGPGIVPVKPLFVGRTLSLLLPLLLGRKLLLLLLLMLMLLMLVMRRGLLLLLLSVHVWRHLPRRPALHRIVPQAPLCVALPAMSTSPGRPAHCSDSSPAQISPCLSPRLPAVPPSVESAHSGHCRLWRFSLLGARVRCALPANLGTACTLQYPNVAFQQCRLCKCTCTGIRLFCVHVIQHFFRGRARPAA